MNWPSFGLVCRCYSWNFADFQKNPRVVKFVSAILGPEMAAPILWAPRISAFFLQENLHVHKIHHLGGGVFFGFGGGGGSAEFIFMGAGIWQIVFLPGHNLNYIANSREVSFVYVPLFPMIQNKHQLQFHIYFLRDFLCCQLTVTIRLSISLYFISCVICLWTMVISACCIQAPRNCPPIYIYISLSLSKSVLREGVKTTLSTWQGKK